MTETLVPAPRRAEAYEENQAWPAALAASIALHLRRAAPRTAAFLGCATGVNDAFPFARLAPETRVLASDVDPDFLRTLAERGRGMSNVRVGKVDITSDLDSLPPVDLLAIFFVVHRVAAWRSVVPGLLRLVAPGGRLFTSEFAGPGGIIYLSNENGGHAGDPVSRLIRRYVELRGEPFAPPLKSSNMGPFLAAVARGLEPVGHRDFPWPQSLTVAEAHRKMEIGAYAPYVGLRPPPELFDRLRDEFSREWRDRVDLVETIRVHEFRRA